MPRNESPAAKAAPKQPGRLKQIAQVFQETRKADASTIPYMLLGLLAPIAVAVPLTWLAFDSPWYGLFIGLMIGILVAMFILARKAESAAYSRIAGQKGAALAAMGSIRRGWNVEQEPCALDARSQEMLFRASGRAGVALVSESSTGGAMRLLEKEGKRLERLLPNVPVHKIIVGDDKDKGEVPLPKLAAHMTRMKPVLTKEEAAAVAKRLQAMPNPIRQAIPKGIDPTRARPNRKAMRGR